MRRLCYTTFVVSFVVKGDLHMVTAEVKPALIRMTDAPQALGISRATLLSVMKYYGIKTVRGSYDRRCKYVDLNEVRKVYGRSKPA